MPSAAGVQDNRDKRVELLQKYARKFFPATRYLDYALRVERYTLTKAANLVLNVDGCIGALFLDLLHSSSQFSQVPCMLGQTTSCCSVMRRAAFTPYSKAGRQLVHLGAMSRGTSMPPDFACTRVVIRYMLCFDRLRSRTSSRSAT